MESWKAELYHHGIQGQKWGVRRYQNADGSLTAAGKKHQSQLSKIKSSNSAESSSSGGGGGGGAMEELTDEEKEIVDELIDPETWGGRKSTEDIRRVAEDFDSYLEENYPSSLVESLTRGQKSKMQKAALEALEKRDGVSRNQGSAGGRTATKLRKDLEEDYSGYTFQGKESGAEKLHNRKPLTHSSSGKAYVGSLGMKWKINR